MFWVFALFDEFDRPRQAKGSGVYEADWVDGNELQTYVLVIEAIDDCWSWDKFIVLNKLAMVLKSIGFGSFMVMLGFNID